MKPDRDQVELVAWVARISARLAHKFADRHAILFRSGVDERGWAARERACLSALEDEHARGATALAIVFASAYASAREALLGGHPPRSTASPEARSIDPSWGSSPTSRAPSVAPTISLPAHVALGPSDTLATLKSPTNSGARAGLPPDAADAPEADPDSGV